MLTLLFAVSIKAQNTTALGEKAVQSTFFQHVKPRTNLLYWLTATPNLGVDIPLGQSHWSLGANVGYNAWKHMPYGHDMKLRHVLAALELRHWAKPEVLHPHGRQTVTRRSAFWGIDAVYSHYNAGRVFLPFDIYSSLHHQYKQGDLAALGAFGGYTWRISRVFRLEAEAGLGIGYADYQRHDCDGCYQGDGKKGFLVPKLAINLVLDPLKRVVEEQPVVTPEVIAADTVKPEPPFMPAIEMLQLASVADTLTIGHPIVESYETYRPYDRTRVMRKEKGMLYVHFPFDKSDLRRDFRDNAAVLDEIVSLTQQIMDDPRSRVHTIQIIGLASIEGAVQHNQTLSDHRAKALRDYVMAHVPGISEDQFEVVGGGEAWSEFRDQVNDLLIAKGDTRDYERHELQTVLRVIDTEQDLNRREYRLRHYNHGHVFRMMLRPLLADQRNSGYVRIYFDRVADRQGETINEGSRLLQQQRYDEALATLLTVKDDPRSWNALGVALYMTGSKQEATDYFHRAAQQGNQQARENLRQLGY